MGNSILNSLPQLHGTMLSIIVGFFTAYALYAYQATNSAKQNLEYLKRQVQNISKPSFEGGLNYTEYTNDDGMLDWQRIKRELHDIAGLYSLLDFEKYGLHREIEPVQESEIEAAARKLLGLTGLIATSYPYLGRGMLHKGEIDGVMDSDSWVEDLDRYNGFLVWFWNTYNRGLNELMTQYRRLDVQRQRDMHEKNLQQMIKGMEKQGAPPLTKEKIARIRKEFHIVHDIDYNLILRDFFSKVLHLEHQIIPKTKESQIVLTTYQNQFRVKTRAMWVLIGAIFIFFLGVLTPLVIGAYVKPPILRGLELTLLVVTTAPYLLGLFYLISVVAGLKQP